MTLVRRAAIGLISALVALALVGVARSRTWVVERSIVMHATPEVIHGLVANLRRWNEWSAWTRNEDPAGRYTYEGPTVGQGAKRLWLGPVLGRGSSEITNADPVRGVWLDERIESAEVNAHASLTYVAEGGGTTRVNWHDSGDLPPVIGSWFRQDVERRLGERMEESLSRLKQLAESARPDGGTD